MCTSLAVTDKSGNVYHGRTMEFSGPAPGTLTYLPAGTTIQSLTATGKPGMNFDTKFAVLGMTGDLVSNAQQPTVIDGANSQGLSLSANAMMNSSLRPADTEASKTLSLNDFAAWVLGGFETVSAVKSALLDNDIGFWLPEIPSFGNLAMPLHFAIHDRTGDAIVVEFMDGKKSVYDNPVNVMTNGPTFPWHITNLQNYTFTNLDTNVGQLGALRIETVDSGIALTSLPSAQTSQGRFVKAAFYASYCGKGATPDEAILQLSHIMNNFDRPYGLTIDGEGGMGDGPRSNGISSEITDYTIMKDLTRNRTYVRGKDALNWTMIDMNKLRDVKKTKTVSVYDIGLGGAESFGDIWR
jgi:choloylglycine hydrolase